MLTAEDKALIERTLGPTWAALLANDNDGQVSRLLDAVREEERVKAGDATERAEANQDIWTEIAEERLSRAQSAEAKLERAVSLAMGVLEPFEEAVRLAKRGGHRPSGFVAEQDIYQAAQAYATLQEMGASGAESAADRGPCPSAPLEQHSDGWRDIETHKGCHAVLVSRPTGREVYAPTTAFLDATGVWRVYRSEGGMTPLPFTPSHWMPLPAPPAENAAANPSPSASGPLPVAAYTPRSDGRTPPPGYVRLGDGLRCRCVELWQQANGEYWCCQRSAPLTPEEVLSRSPPDEPPPEPTSREGE